MRDQGDKTHGPSGHVAMLRERELAERWKTSQRTLQRWRAESLGPAWIRIGGTIRYLMADVLDYEARHRGGEDR